MGKLVIYVDSLSRGGAEHVSVTLADYAAHHGIECILLTERILQNEYPVPKGVKRISLELDHCGNKYFHYLSNVSRLRSKLKEIKPDRLLVMDTPGCLLAIPATRGLPIRVIVSERNDPNHFPGKNVVKHISRTLMKYADGFVFQTEDAKKFYDKKLRNRGTVIYNPLYIEKLPTIYNGRRAKKIVTMGRLSEQKNQKILIEAFSKIEGAYPEYELIIYGEGSLRETLEKQVRDLGIEQKVKLPGNDANVLEKIRDAGIFVLSSNYEGMPNALIEAMALGIPSISTDCPCGGPKTLVQPYINGLLFPVEDVDALVSCIKYFIENEEKADEIGMRATEIRTLLASNRICEEWSKYIWAV